VYLLATLTWLDQSAQVNSHGSFWYLKMNELESVLADAFFEKELLFLLLQETAS
jgi:hypothetical protein